MTRVTTVRPVPSRVVIVDDVADLRGMLRVALRLSPSIEVVGEASGGAEAVDVVAAQQPDVVVLDLGLPDLSASEVVRRLREVSPAKIVVFTGRDVGVGTGFDERVEGFIRKDEDVRLVVALIENLHAAGRHSAALALRMDVGAASAARAFVEEQCLVWGCLDAVDTAKLIVSELVTNAVLHAASHPQLLVSYNGMTMRLQVSDDSHAAPMPRVAAFEDESGRGLLLVDAFAAAWGVEDADSGKRVWAELPCRPPVAGAAA